MGLDVYMYRFATPPDEDTEDNGGEQIEIASAIHPDHLFKIGYMRSSYTASGINGILDDRIGTDLYRIFGMTWETRSYYQRPDWGACKVRAVKALADLRAWLSKNGSLSVWTVTHNAIRGLQKFDKADALRTFSAERETFADYDYENVHGAFMPKGCTIYAAIAGVDSLGSPGLHLICDGDKTDSYAKALEVVVEMCEWAMGQPDRENLWLAWRG